MAELFTIENPNISLIEKDQVRETLARQEKLFAAGKEDFGGIHNVKDFIDTGDSPPDTRIREKRN